MRHLIVGVGVVFILVGIVLAALVKLFGHDSDALFYLVILSATGLGILFFLAPKFPASEASQINIYTYNQTNLYNAPTLYESGSYQIDDDAPNHTEKYPYLEKQASVPLLEEGFELNGKFYTLEQLKQMQRAIDTELDQRESKLPSPEVRLLPERTNRAR